MLSQSKSVWNPLWLGFNWINGSEGQERRRQSSSLSFSGCPSFLLLCLWRMMFTASNFACPETLHAKPAAENKSLVPLNLFPDGICNIDLQNYRLSRLLTPLFRLSLLSTSFWHFRGAWPNAQQEAANLMIGHPLLNDRTWVHLWNGTSRLSNIVSLEYLMQVMRIKAVPRHGWQISS